MTWKYARLLKRVLDDPRYTYQKIVHFTYTRPQDIANEVYLICAFQVLILSKTPQEAWKPFSNLEIEVFRDAGSGPCSHPCTILDCLTALHKSVLYEWFNMSTFDYDQYTRYERIEEGDMNWIIPSKILAMSSPVDEDEEIQEYRMSMDDYGALLKKLGVTAVIRLNKRTYDGRAFKQYGINHYDLIFPDGSVPCDSIIARFLSIVNKEKALAVHCKAGLGRTGTLIGCYMIKYHKMTANEFIAWCRICRPGSVIGPQQDFLVNWEARCEKFEVGRNHSLSPDKRFDKRDGNQARRLLDVKKTNQEVHIRGSSVISNTNRLNCCKENTRRSNITPLKLRSTATLDSSRSSKSTLRSSRHVAFTPEKPIPRPIISTSKLTREYVSRKALFN